MSIWTLSFVCAAISVCTLGVFFWTSFLVFAVTSVYIQKHQKKLLGDIDNMFNFKDEEFL